MRRLFPAIVALLAAALVPAAAQRSTTLPALSRLASLNATATPHDYSMFRAALIGALGNDDWRGNGATVFGNAQAQRVSLGTLGTGYVFQGLGGCGATGNCSVAVVYPKPGGGWAAYVSGGDGLVLAGSGPIPDIYITWNMSAATGNVSRVRFEGGRYVADGSEGYRNDTPLPENATPVAQNSAATFPLPGRNTQALGPASLSPNEYQQLRAAVLRSLETHLSPATAAAAFDNAHGLAEGLQGMNVLALLKAGDCDARGNCSIFAFRGHLVQGMMTMPTTAGFELQGRPVRGWSATGGTYYPGLFSDQANLNLEQITVARRLSASELALEHYREVPADRFGARRLAMDQCADLTGDVGPSSTFNPSGIILHPAACYTPPPPQRAIPVDKTAMGTVLVDSSGAVWGARSDQMPCEGELYRWSGGHWLEQLPPQPDVSLDGIHAAPNGDVIARWSSCAGPFAPVSLATALRGDKSTVQPSGAEPPPGAIQTSMGVLVPVGGDMRLPGSAAWVPGHEPGLARWSPGQAPVRVFTYDDNQFRIWPNSNQWPGPGGLRSLTDSAGTTWIWGSGFAHGLLLVRGGSVETHLEVPGLPDAPIRSLAPWDANHFVAFMDQGGLYQIDTASLQASLIPAPQPEAFNAVEAVFSAGGDRYVVAGRRRGPTNGVAGALTLWRLRDGNWQAVVGDLGQIDCCLLNGSAWAWTNAGLWISALPSGIWRVLHDGPAELVDWRHGLPFGASISRMIALDPAHLYVTDGRDNSAEFDVNAVLAVKPPANNFSLTNAWGRLARDAHGRIWALQADALAEWDGHTWTPHPFPGGIQRARLTGVNIDSDGRVWLLPNCTMGPVAIYSPAGQAWTATYVDYRNELRQQAEGRHFLDNGRVLDPVQSASGQMAFFGPCGGLNYFNGQRWQLWQPNQLLRDMPGDGRASQPGFDNAGNLIVDVYDNYDRSVTWKWDESSWVRTAAQALPALPAQFRQPALAPPPSCATPWPESLTFDADGRGWWTAGGNLYVGVGGNCKVVLAASEIQPFVDGRGVTAVTLDGAGNAFVATDLPAQLIFLPGAGAVAESVKPSR